MKKPLLTALVALMTMLAFAQGGEVPAYNAAPPPKSKKLPPILPKESLWGPNFQNPIQVNSYLAAAKVEKELYQVPCYCYCDRMGHNSLRSCFESTHGANCAHCMREAFYTYQQKRKGKTLKQIRAGIISGEWRNIDLQAASDEFVRQQAGK